MMQARPAPQILPPRESGGPAWAPAFAGVTSACSGPRLLVSVWHRRVLPWPDDGRIGLALLHVGVLQDAQRRFQELMIVPRRLVAGGKGILAASTDVLG